MKTITPVYLLVNEKQTCNTLAAVNLYLQRQWSDYTDYVCVTLDSSKPTAEAVASPPLAPTFTKALSTRRVYSTYPKKRTRLTFEVNSGVDRCVCSKPNESVTDTATNIGLLLKKFSSDQAYVATKLSSKPTTFI